MASAGGVWYAYEGVPQYRQEAEPPPSALKLQQLSSIWEDEVPRLLEALSPLATGYIICCLLVLEGSFVLVDLPRAGAIAGLEVGDSAPRVLWVLLEGFGLGDLVAALIGSAGLWLSSGGPPLYPSNLGAWRVWTSTLCVGTLLVWRMLVTVAVVPWVGFMVAFETPGYARGRRLAGAVIYMAAGMYSLGLLFAALQAAISAAQRTQEAELLLPAPPEQRGSPAAAGLDERQALLPSGGQAKLNWANQVGGAGPAECEAPTLLGCLPLEPAVAGYTLASCVGSLWLFTDLIGSGRTTGGWAFMAVFPNQPSLTFWVEALVYLVTIGFALFAASAILAQRRLRRHEDTEEVAAAKADASRRSSAIVLAFFLASAFRFALFILITGAALATRDTCGLYSRGLAAVALDKRSYPLEAPVHCKANDMAALLMTIVVAAVDCHFVWGVHELARRYVLAGAPSRQAAPSDAEGSLEASGTYGATGGK